MNAAAAIRRARENGVHLGVEGDQLILHAPREPAPTVLEDIRRHKAGILELLTATGHVWSAKDWKAFFEERSAIGEFDGRLARPKAEAQAFADCLTEWLRHSPARSDPERCALCHEKETSGSIVHPSWQATGSRTWLHPQCFGPWHEGRRLEATEALARIGLHQPGRRRPAGLVTQNDLQERRS